MEHPTPPLHQAEPELNRLGENRIGSRPAPVEQESSPLEQKILETLRAEPITARPEEAPTFQPPETPAAAITQAEPIPARMLNEFVYCQRLFYYEYVEGIFVESADTLRGSAIHKKVDSGSGAMPDAKTDGKAEKPAEPEVIHSRSVQLSSERLGVIAKMDLVEVRSAPASSDDDLFSQAVREVVPVDYKAGAPREGDAGNELWDTDKMQLGLQALILRDNGYTCNEGVIYYRTTKQRVRLPVTSELENWVIEKIAEAKKVMTGTIPAPLVDSPKCVRCSLAPVCLPDETRLLHLRPDEPAPTEATTVRRLIAARDETRPLYLNSPGFRVGCKDEVLQVKDKEKLVEEVRIRDVSHVALFGNIQITTQAIQVLCEQGVPITYFSMGGWFYGITRGHELKNVFLRMEQFRFARDPITCLALARQFVHGKIRNHRTMLMRNHVEPPESVILKLKRAADDALEATSIEQLLGIEGAAASQYFQHFNGMIKDADAVTESEVTPLPTFNFSTRNRRPPTDPVNALLSLSYSMLSKDCTLACLAVGFDPYIGFYHQPRFGRPALGLDLMEEFRPLVAESSVLNCINNRIVTEKDFVRAGNAVNLSPAGRKRFFQVYEQRMSSLLSHPVFEYKVSYRRALELQARLLGKTLTGEIAQYIPLLTR
jgi:CRISPR-associated protein Cas1